MRGRFIRRLIWVALLLGAVLGAPWPAAISADQAQYFYDELGRLVGVQDSQGNTAVYSYDEVGNLLGIERFTAGAGIGIFLLAPSRGLVGAEIVIQGFGFSPSPADNQVVFTGTPALVVSAQASSLIVTVPPGASTGPVAVTSANGTATSPQAFTVLVPPIIAGVSVERVGQGTAIVAISGFNLAEATAVQFAHSGITATLLPGSTAQRLLINLTVGPSVPPGSYTFSITTPSGTAQSGAVVIAVTPPVPSFGVGKLSVFRPFPAETPPSGPTFSVAPPLSVGMPQ